MARKTTVMLQDDLDGTPATQTIRFGYQGIDYEIDLNDVNAKEMTTWLENYVSHGRRVGGRKQPGAKPLGSTEAAKIRAWASAQGFEVSSRGRIPAQLARQFEEAH
jgi:Lsr2